VTAHDLIDSIFARPQAGLAGNIRSVTIMQLGYLRDLIGQDPEGGAIRAGAPGCMIWMPSGRWKYILAEDSIGNKHTLTRMGTLKPSGAGELFPAPERKANS
jgi:hypothetical protein